MKKDILDKVCGENVKDICSEKDVLNKNICNNRFIEVSNNRKRELQSTKYLFPKKV